MAGSVFLDKIMFYREECKDSQKQNGLLIKPPKYAPPFSDEWLAAIEAAGEVIQSNKIFCVLMLKSFNL